MTAHRIAWQIRRDATHRISYRRSLAYARRAMALVAVLEQVA
jgi:hypothetical protein